MGFELIFYLLSYSPLKGLKPSRHFKVSLFFAEQVCKYVINLLILCSTAESKNNLIFQLAGPFTLNFHSNYSYEFFSVFVN